MIGQTVGGRYQIIKKLGGGGFGNTYVAQDLQRPGLPSCVVKHLIVNQPSLELLKTARRLFQQEAETLEKLGVHPQIPRLLAYFEESKQFYLVQELIEGEPLSAELGRAKWSEAQAIELLQQLLSILAFVHQQGVIHRDIKPENIIRQADGKLFLIDFGAVKAWQQATNFNQSSQTIAIGTLGYMPIEQARGLPIPSSDLYALGMVVIYALTANPPMHLGSENNNQDNWDQADISTALRQFLTKMVSDSTQRYPTAVEAEQALAAVVADLSMPTTVWHESKHNQTAAVSLTSNSQSNTLRQPSLVVWLITGVAFMLGLGIAYLLTQSNSIVQGDRLNTPTNSDDLDSPSSVVNPFSQLDYPLAVCGDAVVNAPFYRVYVSEVANLNQVKTDFCQDALVKGDRVQVGAFDQQESAAQFQAFLQQHFEAVEIETVE